MSREEIGTALTRAKAKQKPRTRTSTRIVKHLCHDEYETTYPPVKAEEVNPRTEPGDINWRAKR